MSKRRESWKPGGATDSNKGSGTTLMQADSVRQAKRTALPTTPPPPEKDDVAVAGTGRGLPVAAGPGPSADADRQAWSPVSS